MIYNKIKGICLAVFLLGFQSIISQNVPKYVLIEHFTNTWCPICASKNPTFFSLIQKYPKNVHHVSIHPPYPYSGCPLYQYNRTENLERATYYKVQGSPSLVINGGVPTGSTPLLSEANLKNEIAKTSPVSVVVKETRNGGARNATILVKSSSPIAGDLRLVVLVAEQNLRFTASNGELDHYNVFRKFLTPVTGQKITIPSTSEQKFDFNFMDTAGWNPEQVYVLAFVQQANTNEVLNSGTKFDALTTGLKSGPQIRALSIYPTIAQQQINVERPSDKVTDYQILSVQGQIINQGILNGAKQASISITGLTAGVYWIKIQDDKHVFLAKFIKI
jgi:thiol-disulfide isomerase/thioredoxin